MKRPVKAMVTVGIALVLISGVAYAADKRKRAKDPMLPPEAVPDDEAVKAELLAAVEGQQVKGKLRQREEATPQNKDKIVARQPQKE